MQGQRLILIQGDARRIPLADRSVHCVVTSPPYWSLRDYGLAPSVWGGEELYQHDFTSEVVERENRRGLGLADSPACTRSGAKKIATVGWQKFTHGFCRKCGAWFGCLGLEPTPELFIEHQVLIFREVRRVLRDDGTLWLNIGDCYNASNGGTKNGIGEAYGRSPDKPGHDRDCRVATAVKRNLVKRRAGNDCDPKRGAAANGQPMHASAPNLKPKDLVGIPWMLAFALRADGWYLRQENIWHKPNPMPESVTDRCTKSHEQVFLLTKSPRYFYDADAIREPVTSTGGASFGPQTKIKVPNGWDTGKGGHGSFHREGRGATEYKRLDDGHIHVDGVEVQSRKLESADQRNHPLGRNKRSVWTIATQAFPEAHFATFPVKLVNPCIQAGTSEKGCCRKCGAQWTRVVERINAPGHNGKTESAYEPGSTANRLALLRQAARKAGGEYVNARVTTTWLASCKCNAGEPVPCIVLDPFSGAATTGVAAKLLGRSYIGIEPKVEYIEISRNRLKNAKHGKVKRKAKKKVKQEAMLFGA